MLPSVQNAIAKVEVVRDGVVVSRGTGSLVGENVVLTSLHVVAQREVTPVQFHPGEIFLTFPNYLPLRAAILQGKWDAREDWVLLVCTQHPPRTIRPLGMALLERDGDGWETHGFPDAKAEGLTVGGIVRNHRARLLGDDAYQLLCDEAGAGQGLRVRGLSGAPVIVDSSLVGVIRWSLLTDDRNEGGTLYACPASVVAARCAEFFPEPLRSVSSASGATAGERVSHGRRKWWAAAAVVATLVAAYPFVPRLHFPAPPPDAEDRGLSASSAGAGSPQPEGAKQQSSPARNPLSPPPPQRVSSKPPVRAQAPSSQQKTMPQACPAGASLVGEQLELPPGGDKFQTAPELLPCVYRGMMDTNDEWKYYKLSVKKGQTLKATFRLRDSDLPRLEIFRGRLHMTLHGLNGESVAGTETNDANGLMSIEFRTKEDGFAYVAVNRAVRDSSFQFTVQ